MKMSKITMKNLVLAFAALLLAGGNVQAEKLKKKCKERPNVLIIFPDQLRR
jgi:outer membrane biogenesis lipoprotein LolB